MAGVLRVMILIGFSAGVAAAQSVSPRLAALQQSLLDGDSKAPAVFWSEVITTGAPLVEEVQGTEEVLVTFLMRSEAPIDNAVVFASVLPDNDAAKQRLTRLQGTDVWFRTYRLHRDVPILYELSSDGPQNLQRDPLNPQFLDGPMGGSVVMPRGSARISLAVSHPEGRVEESRFTSARLRNERKVSIYSPPGFQPGRTHDLVIVLDEDVYNGAVNLPRILDGLIAAGRLRPAVVAMVGNVSREPELSCNADFSRMLAEEFLPWIRKRYKLPGRGQATIAGSSLGGLAAACAGFQESQAFGRVIALSGSFRWRPAGDPEPEWLTRQIAGVPPRPVRFFVGVGSFETGTPREPANPSLLTAARHLRDVLKAKGYRHTYREFPGAHEPLSWSLVIGDALAAVQSTR